MTHDDQTRPGHGGHVHRPAPIPVAKYATDRQQGRVTHLLEVAEFVVLAQLFKVVDSLGVVEAVVVVDLAVTCQLTELCHVHTKYIQNSLINAGEQRSRLRRRNLANSTRYR